MCTRIKEGDST